MMAGAVGVDRLHVSTVDVKPVEIDWRPTDDYGDFAEERDSWEVFDYDHHGETFQLVARTGGVVAVVIDGHAFDRYDDYADLVEEPALTEETFDDLMAADPYEWGAEGPMMNYWYPVEEDAGRYGWGTGFDPVAAAVAVADFPVCVVEVDGAYGLALTGGGMDLSWEICGAFIALGKLPPVHFAHLPAFAEEWSDRKETVVRAMRRSIEVQTGWLERESAHLDTLQGRAR